MLNQTERTGSEALASAPEISRIQWETWLGPVTRRRGRAEPHQRRRSNPVISFLQSARLTDTARLYQPPGGSHFACADSFRRPRAVKSRWEMPASTVAGKGRAPPPSASSFGQCSPRPVG